MPRERFEAFAAVKNIPSIRRKAEFCFRWIDGIYDLRELRTTGDGWSFLLNLICFAACIEGLFFYGAAHESPSGGRRERARGPQARKTGMRQFCLPPARRSHGGPATPVASAAAGTSRVGSGLPRKVASRIVNRCLVHSEVAAHDNQGRVSGARPRHDRGR
jgi:hypothetical protein